MKTTIELSDELLLQAKHRALEQGVTLKSLIERGLRIALQESKEVQREPYRFPVITQMSRATASGEIDVNALIDQMRDEADTRLTAP